MLLNELNMNLLLVIGCWELLVPILCFVWQRYTFCELARTPSQANLLHLLRQTAESETNLLRLSKSCRITT